MDKLHKFTNSISYAGFALFHADKGELNWKVSLYLKAAHLPDAGRGKTRFGDPLRIVYTHAIPTQFLKTII